MEMKYLSGRSFYSHTVGTKKEDGEWEVTVTMSETLAYPNGTVREESITHSGKNSDFDTAHKEALKSTLQDLQDYVYSKGFDSLIEGLDYQKGLEEFDGTKADTNEATPS